ncbi:MAG: hypothetical protein ACI8PT_002692, partial [Gammaproteobacteria bacterium]
MNLSERIAHLGWLAGIHRDYWDIWGQQHQIKPETERQFLQAMGFDLADAHTVEREIDQIENRHWYEPMAPVVLGSVGQPINVALTLPRDTNIDDVQWRLIHEDGNAETPAAHALSYALTARQTVQGKALSHWQVSIETRLLAGYHRLTFMVPKLEGGAGESATQNCETTLIVAPSSCYHPTPNRRRWGIALQLYSLRSSQNWGIGDFADLRAAGLLMAARGADFVGLNPLHALFSDSPERASPYSPSSRSFVNPIYLCVGEMDDFQDAEAAVSMVDDAEIIREVNSLRASELVDYPRVSALKNGAFDIAFAHFKTAHLAPRTDRASAFRRFKDREGTALHQFALHEALRNAQRPLPVAHSVEATQLASEFSDAIERSQYLQWQCNEQLGNVAKACHAAGMTVGLYRDLAVGCDSEGADIWNDPE